MSGRPKQPKYARNKNILVIGGSGSGKTRFFVKPNLMQDKKSHYVPEDEWTIFENTHEAIISRPLTLCRKSVGMSDATRTAGAKQLPHRLAFYCADCGGKMYVHRTNNGKRISQYTCSQYSKVPVGKLCTTQHRINEDVVLSLVSRNAQSHCRVCEA